MSVCLRFAPSPTGLLHVGNARMALINWLYAQQNKGQFVLRIDDTDQERSTQAFEDQIKQDLMWLGLTYNISVRQSERFHLYRAAQQTLIDQGRLYPCYETQEELVFKRKRQLARGEPPRYDRAGRTLTQQQQNDFEQQGRRPHWRFQMEDTDIQWDDLLRGPVRFHGSDLSDPVLIREDGVPLYLMPSVVDDLDLGITHVLRGEDHVSNTAIHIQLMAALRNPSHTTAPTQFGHFSLLMDAEGRGLSKRLGSLSLASLREAGMLPISICSLLSALGTSRAIEPHTSLDTLIEAFDASTFSRNPPKFDPDDLKALNTKVIHVLAYEDLAQYQKNSLSPQAWDFIRENIHQLSDIQTWEKILYGDITPVVESEDQEYIQLALDCMPQEPWDNTTLGHMDKRPEGKNKPKRQKPVHALKAGHHGTASRTRNENPFALFRTEPRAQAL